MTIAVIGGGAAGCSSALELANKGYRVIIFERNNGLLGGSSNSTPWRMSLGFHYIDEFTAMRSLDKAIALLKEHPEYRFFPAKPTHYYIVKNSLFSVSRILATYEALKSYYRHLIEIDPANKLFGEPEEFYQILSVSQYDPHIDTTQVVMGIITYEPVLNWPYLKNHLISQIVAHPNIEIRLNSQVLSASHSSSTAGYVLKIKDQANIYSIEPQLVINASWYDIERINYTVGFFTQPELRTNRLKCMIKIKLPASWLINNASINSMFFCFGPHCSFSYLDNGYGFITYEPVTNVEQSNSLALPPLTERLLNYDVTEREKQEYANAIIRGVGKYIHEIEEAELIECYFGIVKTLGEVKIDSPLSEFHKRSYCGVEVQNLTWIDNACVKLLHFHENAKILSKLVKENFAGEERCERISSNLFKLDTVKKHAMLKYLQLYTDASELQNEKQEEDLQAAYQETIHRKETLSIYKLRSKL